MNYIAKCMLCPKFISVDLTVRPNIDFAFVAEAISRKHNWPISQTSKGTFICCEDCYDTAFDRSKGGNVGFLKAEFDHLRK